MITARRRAFKIGGSKAVTLSKKCRIAETVTIVCGGELALVDPTGETREEDLLRFFILYMEPGMVEGRAKEGRP